MAHPIVVTAVTAAGGASEGPVETHGVRSYRATAPAVKLTETSRCLIRAFRLDIGFMPEALAVNDGIPIICLWKLIDYASKQQIVLFAFVVCIIAVEIEVHSGNRYDFFDCKVLYRASGERMLSTGPGARIQIDSLCRSI